MSGESLWGSESGQPPVAVQLEALRKKVVMLEAENRRFMASQGQLIAESNRKTEAATESVLLQRCAAMATGGWCSWISGSFKNLLHLNEIGLLKEEVRNLRKGNKELRDLCCFLDDDRQKSRKLAKEWQKFANYTSHLMKQEVHAYQGRLREMEDRHQMMVMENDQLKRLCLYLDEQRQTLINSSGCFDENDNSGCESSGRGSDAADEPEADEEREKAIRLITKEMQTSISLDSQPSQHFETHDNGDRIISYIQSLENRIKQLELGGSPHQQSSFWPSQSSDLNNATVIEKGSYWCSASSDDVSETLESASLSGSVSSDGRSKDMMSPSNGKMAESTSSGTTYCSSLTDDSGTAAVLVMGDGMDPPVSENLEVRTLGPIDEEEDSTATEKTIPELPPPIAPISESVGRLSSCSSDVTNSSGRNSRFSDDISQIHRPPVPNYSAPRDSLAEAVEVLRVHEMAARRSNRGLSTKQTAILQQMCQVAWDSLDRKSKAQQQQSKTPPPQISSAV
ncbi:hypothetical protein QR680_006128 [Steinernema hermaphroditum]|uniref:Coiled-coil domain-containing protein 85C n=1 Tax=Steinernema hermaphroditum TaxID=289476 RepID=A0AA39HUD7_9BILA|nr:hypothetical protein QR680_006128 [Steinernema hermaphroditum]